MTFVALWIPDWPTGAAANDLLAQLLAVAPRAAIAPREQLAWLDARGLDPVAMAARAREVLGEIGVTEVFAGAAKVPIAAQIVAQLSPRVPRGGAEAATTDAHRYGSVATESDLPRCARDDKQVIPPGTERSFLAPLPLGVLGISETLHTLLHAVGITSCGDFSRLSRESVEVRFGREGLAMWRLARADDPRPIFSSRPRELPNASLDWTEFSTTDLEQLVFVLNALLKTVCEAIAAEGTGVRSLTLTLALENRTTITQSVGAARSTAQRTLWSRLMRRALERITLPDRVIGVAVQVDAVGAPAVRQGDLFDLGFASAEAAESAVAHVMGLQHDAVVRVERSGHPLMERRIAWRADELAADVAKATLVPHNAGAALTASAELHPMILPSPREVAVIATNRRGFLTPIHYTDNAVPYPLKESLGPHCISGDRWTERVAREYHQCVRADGTVVLLYRHVQSEQWYLAGWWD